MIKDYVAIARPGHWFKQVFILPGVVVAALLTDAPFSQFVASLILGFMSANLICSANYTINEWLDAELDRFHPMKKNRPSVLGRIKFKFLVLQYVALAGVGLVLAWMVSEAFFWTSVVLLLMGLAYNMKPIRTKDRAYLDVLSESVNNPIRLLLGWFIVTSSVLPPVSLLIAYWMGGAFLMAVKRYAEFRLIADRSTAALYRRSFGVYTENSLLVSIMFYAMTFAFFFGIFMIKYRIELLLSLPLFSILFAWYLSIGMLPNSPAQHPEKLYREKYFGAYVLAIVAFVTALLYFRWPSLDWFLNRMLLPLSGG
jgi:4-hydroxybenzoate polyprenyltransferase